MVVAKLRKELDRYGATGVGRGLKIKGGRVTDQECIVFFVPKKLTFSQLLSLGLEEIPKTIEGYPTDVVEVEFRVRQDDSRYRPIKGGIAGINYRERATGTLGYVSSNGEILSNNHVLALGSTEAANIANKGDGIIQPGCFSEDTRVLTENGLKYFYELMPEDKIMTLNLKTGEIEYQKPLMIHRYYYSGKMVKFKGQMYSFLVTPNHQLVVANEVGRRRIEIVVAEEFVKGYKLVYEQAKKLQAQLGNKYREIGRRLGINPHTVKTWLYYGSKPGIKHGCYAFLKTGKWNCEDREFFTIPLVRSTRKTKGITRFRMDDWLEFFGWYISEGSLGGPSNESRHHYKIQIRQTKPENLKKIAEVVKRLGFKPNIRFGKEGGVTFFSKELYYYLKQFGHAKDKFIPKELKNLPATKLKILLSSLLAGDGSFVSPDEYSGSVFWGNPRRYTTSSKKLADDLVEIGIKCGYAVSISERSNVGFAKGKMYVIGFSSRNLTPRITKEPELIDYQGMVYDVTVPNGTLMVEHDGKLTWSGNSHGGGKYPDDKVGELDRWVVLKVSGSTDGCLIGNAVAKSLNAIARVLGRRGRFQYIYSTAYNRVDGAVAKATVDYEEGVMVEPGKVVKLEKPDPKPDRKLGAARAKRGRTTLFTIGTVYAVDVTVPVSGYAGNTTAYFENQVAIIGDGDKPFSLGGDSGALIYDSNTMKPTELLFAGGRTPDGLDITIGNPIEYVIEELNYKF